MNFIFDWVKSFFNRFLRFTLPGYQQRMKSLVRRNTVGKVEAKMLRGQGKLDQKVFKAQDKMMGGAGKTRQPSSAPGGAGPSAPGRSGPPAPGRSAPAAPGAAPQQQPGAAPAQQAQAQPRRPMSPAEAAALRRQQQQQND